MTAAEVLQHLEAVGAVLVSKPPDSKLFVRGPKAAITHDLIKDIQAHKNELLGMLSAQIQARETGPPTTTEETTPKFSAEDLQREADHWMRVFGASVTGQASYPAPIPLRPVIIVCGGEHVRLTFARHNVVGMNRFGQDAAEHPYCVLNSAAWRQKPFDLVRVRWYRSFEDASKLGQDNTYHFEADGEEDGCTCATFPGGIHVSLRKQGNSRWLMWVERHGAERRRKDFASPCLEHARRSAEHFYGVPVNGWKCPGVATMDKGLCKNAG